MSEPVIPADLPDLPDEDWSEEARLEWIGQLYGKARLLNEAEALLTEMFDFLLNGVFEGDSIAAASSPRGGLILIDYQHYLRDRIALLNAPIFSKPR